jgi:hypothetical protein
LLVGQINARIEHSNCGRRAGSMVPHVLGTAVSSGCGERCTNTPSS